MRAPVNPLPGGMRQRIPSVAAAFTVDAYEQQPVDAAAAPVGQLDAISGQLVDDASRNVARTMTVDLPRLPDWLRPGMWLRATVGIQTLQPIIYRMPTLCIVDIADDPSGVTLTAADPGEIVNGRPYETDTTLSGTLRTLVGNACSLALSRPTDVTQVPAITVPAATIAEFGAPRWDVCLSTADALGVALRFTDIGDVIGTLRSDTPPSPVAVVERAVTEGGAQHHVRAPSSARVLVTRGMDAVGLIGSAESVAITGEPLPPWYRPYTVTDRHEGDPTTTQTQANQLAIDLLRARLSELDTLDSMPILPAPWLEAGADVVTFYGVNYALRAVTFDFPALSTAVTLRRLP